MLGTAVTRNDPLAGPAPDRAAQLARRRRNFTRGVLGEAAAADSLAAQGYQVLARRERTKAGEIDLIAVRGQRIAFVEVKARKSLEEAQFSISRRRIAEAADLWLSLNPAYQNHEIGLDAVLVVPSEPPCHVENALQSWVA